jgi:hypothetical protein
MINRPAGAVLGAADCEQRMSHAGQVQRAQVALTKLHGDHRYAVEHGDGLGAKQYAEMLDAFGPVVEREAARVARYQFASP